jgi:hypothetical protein
MGIPLFVLKEKSHHDCIVPRFIDISPTSFFHQDQIALSPLLYDRRGIRWPGIFSLTVAKPHPAHHSLEYRRINNWLHRPLD